jgi:hypothetical protein
LAVEGDLVTSLLSALVLMSVPMAIAVPLAIDSASSFYIIIDVCAFQHLSEIKGHAIKHDSRLCVCVDVLVGGPRNSRCTGHRLSYEENNYQKDEHRHEQLDKGESAFVMPRRDRSAYARGYGVTGPGRASQGCELEQFRLHRLIAANVSTFPAALAKLGCPVVGSN